MVNKRNLVFYFLIALCISFTYFFIVQGLSFPSGDDPAIYLAVSRIITETGKTEFTMPYYPELNKEYSGSISTPLIFSILSITTGVEIIKIPIYLMAFIFCLSFLSIYVLLKKKFKSGLFIIIPSLFFIWSRFGQETFYAGNYNQIIGLFLLPLFLTYLDFSNFKERKVYFILSVFLFFLIWHYHSLTFLISLLILFIFIIKVVVEKFNKKRASLVIAFLIVFYIFILVIMSPKINHFLINNEAMSLSRILSSNTGFPLLMFFFLSLGLVGIINKKNLVFISWIILSLLFSQSLSLGMPFYPWRFNVFLIQSLTFIIAIGIINISPSMNKKVKALFIFFVIIILFSYHAKNVSDIKQIYMEYTPPLKPPIINPSEYRAFVWMEENISNDSIILSAKKWGIYIPAIAGKKVNLDTFQGVWEGDTINKLSQKSIAIYQSSTPEEANSLACETNITHIFWGAGLEIYEGLSLNYINSFENSNLFNKIYDLDGSKIYEVRCKDE